MAPTDPPADTDPIDRSEPAHRSGNRRSLTLSGLALLGLAALGLAWVIVTGLLARSQLDTVRHDLPRLRTALSHGDYARAAALSADIRTHAHRADLLTSGPAWWTVAHLPVVGTPARTSRVITSAADEIGHGVLPGLVRLAGDITGASGRSGSGPRSTVDLARLSAAGPELDSASRAARAANASVHAAPGSWFGTVASARRSLAGQLTALDGELLDAQRAVRIAVPMLGADGPKRYFVGFLNEAEARGLGGIAGAYGIATVDHGRITFDRFGNDGDLRHLRARVDLGADYQARYGSSDPTSVFPNSTLSPDFRDAARIWIGLWQAKTGQHLDGAIALDPTALSYLLRTAGPATLPDGTTVGADNVVALTQQRQYSLYPGTSKEATALRKKYLIDIAEAVSRRLAATTAPQRLVTELGHAARERRFVVYSADPTLETQLIATGWSGAVVPTGDAVTGFVVNNGSGGKIDYYVDRSQAYRRTTCGAGGTATATFTLTNTAPASGLAPYVTTRLDRFARGSRPGSELLLVTYYATPGARLRSVTLDGKPLIIAPVAENGMVTATVDVDLPPGGRRTVRIEVAEPRAAGGVQVIKQPLARKLASTVSTPECAR